MRKFRNYILVIALTFPLAAGNANASFIWGATEWTQIANNIQLLLGYIEQVQQTIQQVKMYEAMLKNLETIQPNTLLQQTARDLWRTKNMSQTLSDLEFMVMGGQRIAFAQSSFESQFKKLHPDYANATKTTDGKDKKAADYQQQYADWSDNTNRVVKESLQSSGFQAENLRNEKDLADQLQRASDSAQGQLQAIQAGNQIATAMLSQLQQLRAIEAKQLEAQAVYLGQKNSKEATSDQNMRNYYAGQNARVQSASEIEKGSK